MTKVHIQRDRSSEDEPLHVVIAELDLDVVPRIGDRISLQDTPVDIWVVRNVSHKLLVVDTKVEQVISITVDSVTGSPCHVYIEWMDDAERPRWISDEMQMDCDVMPRQGDVITIGVNDERYLTEQMPRAVVIVMEVRHTTLLVPGDNPMFFADQTTTAVIVRNVAQPGVATRLFPIKSNMN